MKYDLYPDLPNWNKGGHPKYVGHRLIAGSSEKTTAITNGEVDRVSGFIPNIVDTWANTTPSDYGYYINGWNGQSSPYFLNDA